MAANYFFIILLLSMNLLAKTTFGTKKILINKVPITVEVAETSEQHELGLMYRQALKDGQGMLFIFQNEEIRTFWMKNTFVPLSIGFLDSQKIIIDIQDMKPAESEMQKEHPLYKSSRPAKYAIEVPQGWFKKNNVKVGDKVHF
ncbi:MAG: hypothetical protein BroJett040_09950 [Oligoflexia bacterium]|nr:MAG: hypothetical protein BroJett040_09950 [Oligoflexia bacterium]